MNKILASITAILLLVGLLLIIDTTKHKDIPDVENTVVVKWSGKQVKESNTEYNVVFEPVTKKEVPDTYATPKGFNGIFIETKDKGLTNYAAPQMTGDSIISNSDSDIITMSDPDAWKLISGGIFTEYPSSPYSSIESQIKEIYNKYATTITVPIWYWSNPDNESDFNKTTHQLNLTVNANIANLWIHIFSDIYSQDSKPIINIKDYGMGTWALRGKNHNPNNTLSAHSLGTAIDINPSTGSFNINGNWYGNAYAQKVMDPSTWSSLPECHEKYQVIYEDCPIVKVFKSYGFYWGGDWNTKDNMHFSFLGDSVGRAQGYENYLKYRRK
jgi:hypothetical protein